MKTVPVYGGYLRKANILINNERIEDAAIRQPNKRIQARVILDEIEIEYKRSGKSPRTISMINELLQFLLDHFIPTVPPTEIEMVEEIRSLLGIGGSYIWHDQKWKTCYNSTFAVYIIRDALKYRKLPIVQASRWKKFAVEYVGLVLAA